MARTSDSQVGREVELRQLDELLGGTCAGTGAMVFVKGEPGIGKSHLLAELARRAEAQGCLVLEGSAAEFERELPFGPVIDALDAYVQSLGRRFVDQLAGSGLGDLADVFPSLRSLRPPSEAPPIASERFRAYHAVRELLERLAAQQPLVLILDDLHWADGSTLELVAHLLRRPPAGSIMFAGSFRRRQLDEALAQAIEAALDSRPVHLLDLGPLTPEEAVELLDGIDAATRERLYIQSGGNPFYLLQIARAGTDLQPQDRSQPDGAAAPPAVAAAIARELSALSPDGRTLAQAAAVAGDPFELDLAVATSGLAEDLGFRTIDELIDRDLLRPTPAPRRFRFRHPLVRSATYASCSSGTRLAAHARCASALEAQGAPATTRAYHVEQSARQGDRAAIAVLVEAGGGTARWLPASSARWFEAALRLLPEGAPAEERIELLSAVANALTSAGRLLDARSMLLEGLALLPAAATEERVRFTVACAGVEQRLGRHEEAHDRMVGALDDLTERHSETGVSLMVALAADSYYRVDFEAMRRWGLEATAAASDLGEPLLTAAAEAILALGCAFTGATDEAKAHRRIAAEVVDALADDELSRRIDAIGYLAGTELYLETFEEATAHGARGIAIAQAGGQIDVFPMLYPVLGSSLWVLGRLAEAGEVLDAAVEAARLSGNVHTVAWSLFNRSLAALMAGEMDIARTTVEESVELSRGLGDNFVTSYASVILAWVLFENGDPAGAASLMVSAGGGDDIPNVGGGWRTTHLEVLARCWLALGEVDRARAAAASATAIATQVGLPRSRAMAHRAVAQVALHEGKSAQAVEEAGLSIVAAEASAAYLDAALSRVVLGRAFAQAGDVVLAVPELTRAAAELDAFGSPRFRDEAERELRKLGQRAQRRAQPGRADGGGVASLSARELEVARLVVDRRTNPEIAADLFLSLKTVETHLRNIFRKLEVTSRVELAHAIVRSGV